MTTIGSPVRARVLARRAVGGLEGSATWSRTQAAVLGSYSPVSAMSHTPSRTRERRQRLGSVTDMATRTDVYSHGHDASVLRAHGARTIANSAAYLEPDLQPGVSVLDVGCGVGSITAEIAGRVHPGRVVGVDVVWEAVRATREASANAHVALASGYRLPFADGSFDVVHAHQVLQHLSDPVAALQELRRVCRPGEWWPCETPTTPR